MVPSHPVRSTTATPSTPGTAALLLAICLGFAAIAVPEAASADMPGATQATQFQAPSVPPAGSTVDLAFQPGATTASLRYPGEVRPAYDPFAETTSESVGPTQFISPGEPAEQPTELGQQDRRSLPICDRVVEKPPRELTIDISAPNGLVPQDYASECWPQIAGQTGANPLVRCWGSYCYQWRPTCLAHQPLYFEEINLERHGYGLGDIVQPWVSGAHFFGTVPCLPYLMAVDPPRECIYTLGHYRPGSCPPWQHHWPPLSLAGGLAEAEVLTGLIFLIP